MTQHLSSSHGQGFDDHLDNNDDDEEDDSLGDDAPLKQFRRRRKRKKSGSEDKNQKSEELSSEAAKVDSTESEQLNTVAEPSQSDVATTLVASEDKMISSVPIDPLDSVENIGVGASRQDENKSSTEEAFSQEPVASVKSNETVEQHSQNEIVSNCEQDKTESVVLESNKESENADVVEKDAAEGKTDVETSLANVKSSSTKSEVVQIEMKRPERKCKTTTKALMLLTFAEDYDFADSSSSSSEDDGEIVDKNVIDKNVVDKNCVQNGLTCSSTEDTSDMTFSVQSEEGDSSSTR